VIIGHYKKILKLQVSHFLKTADKFGAFEAELSLGATQIKDAIKNLFS